MAYKSLILALLISSITFGYTTAQVDCPALPETGVVIGEPVPIKPGDIPAGCSDFEILVARGTSEPNYANGGKFGVIVGDPVVSNVSKILSGARGYPVQYPASSSVITGTRIGAADVVARLRKQAALCPSQSFALVGYSQGAGVMHSAANSIPRELFPRIKALVMFGDPNLKLGALRDRFPGELQGKLLSNCAVGDSVCDKGNCTYWHLTYIRQEWVDRAVNFIVNAFNGTPLPGSEVIGLPA